MESIRAVVSAIALIADVVAVVQIVARFFARCAAVYQRGRARQVTA